MVGLLKKYLESTIDNVVKARQQAEGELGVDNMPNDFQSEFQPREPGTKYYPQSPGEDDTFGRWLNKALLYYGSVVTDPLFSNYKDRLVHKYNQRDPGTHYTEQYSETLGVQNIAKDNDIL